MQQVQRDTFQRLTPSLDTWPPITTGGGEGGGGVIPETSREGGGWSQTKTTWGGGVNPLFPLPAFSPLSNHFHVH